MQSLPEKKHFLLEGLNESQEAAVKFTDAPQLILAGAGSGKTRVLIRKLAWLIEECGYSPWNIMAMTFTNKAAKEMKTRVSLLLDRPLRGMWVNTFHSICLRLLRIYIKEAGLENNFVIYDADDKKKIIKKIIKSYSKTELKDDFNLDKPPGASMAGEEISRAKDKLMTPQEFKAYHESAITIDEGLFISEVYFKYQKELQQFNALDFDDIIMKTVMLFQRDKKVLHKLQGKFAYILVDEFQDTNKAQFELIKLLGGAHGRVCAVGDEDQSIYRWRGAEPENMNLFMTTFSEKFSRELNIFKLEENYRSTSEILNIANDIISHNFNRTSEKKLIAFKGSGEIPIHYTAASERDEAAFIAGQIDWMCREEDYSYSDFAVFYRTHSQSRSLEEFFLKAGIPYRLVRGTAFYSRAEIKDIFAYLKVISNPKDDNAITRIINVPPRKIGKVSVEKIEIASKENNLSIAEWIMKKNYKGVLKGQTAKNLSEFADFLIEQIDSASTMELMEFFEIFMNDLGYIEYLKIKGSTEDKARAANLEELKTTIRDFSENPFDDEGDGPEQNSLATFLEYVSLVSDVDLLDENVEKLIDSGFVSLMTLHCAKGLEYRTVFMAGMEEKLLPHFNSLEAEEDIEDERRLCYVGVTRAKERLFLTSSVRRRIYGKTEYNQPSRFVHEIGSENLIKHKSRSLSYFSKG